MKRTAKTEALATLAGGLAHDVNNILSIIDSAAQAALAKGAPAAEMKKIINAAQSGGALTRQLLAFSGQQIALPKSLELKPALAALSVLLQPLLGMDIELHIKSPPRLSVQASEEQLALIALNLALNARDAMPAGGRFSITAAPAKQKSFIRLTFTDTGLGIRASDRKKIFDPFFSGKARGAGLGLSVVQGIVTQLGGSIAVTSKQAKGKKVGGTAFALLLPRAKPAKQKPSGTRPAQLLNVLALAMRDGATRYLAPSNARSALPPPPRRPPSALEKTLQRARERRLERLRRGEEDE